MVFGSAVVAAIVAVAGVAALGAVVSWKRDVKSRWVRWGATGAAVVLGLAAAIVLMFAGHVVRVHPDMTTTEERMLGSRTETLDGDDVELSASGSKSTVIVNESNRTLEVRTMVYGELSPGTMVPPDVAVWPRSVYTLHANIDYVGPGERPPSSISTKGGGQVKYWLTW